LFNLSNKLEVVTDDLICLFRKVKELTSVYYKIIVGA